MLLLPLFSSPSLHLFNSWSFTFTPSFISHICFVFSGPFILVKPFFITVFFALLPPHCFAPSPQNKPFFSVVYFLFLFHLLCSLLFLNIYYLFSHAATSGSCFPFSCPFITPLCHSVFLLPLFFCLTPSQRCLFFRALFSSHQNPHYPALFPPLISSSFPPFPLFLPAPPSPSSQWCFSSFPYSLAACRPAWLISAPTDGKRHRHTHRTESINAFKHSHADAFVYPETYRSRKISTLKNLCVCSLTHSHILPGCNEILPLLYSSLNLHCIFVYNHYLYMQ